MTLAINLIAQAIPNFGGACVRVFDRSAILNLPIKLVDGRCINYKLLIKQNNEGVTVQEETQQHLPRFCPERHINSDGTFCLYYVGATCLKVVDEASANVWVETVYKYLKLQERARAQRKWPNNDTWAHGDAAYHQLRAQSAAAAISNKMASALAERRLRLKQKSSNDRVILEVWIESIHIYSVWELDKRVIDKKQRCFCGRSGFRVPKRLRGCKDHAMRASELAFALRDWEKAEIQYWKALQDKSCCSTCDFCPLRSIQQVA